MSFDQLVKTSDPSKYLEEHPELLTSVSIIGNSILSQAIGYKNRILINILIDKVDIHIRNVQGWAAIHKAASMNDVETLKLLLERGEDINAVDNDGYTPLMIAAISDSFEAVKFLLSKKAETNRVIKQGKNILGLIGIRKEIRDYIQDMFQKDEPQVFKDMAVLEDPVTFSEIKKGEKYAYFIDSKNNYFCLGSYASILDMIEKKFKSSNKDYVFNIILNKLVSVNTILYATRGGELDLKKKFEEKDYDFLLGYFNKDTCMKVLRVYDEYNKEHNDDTFLTMLFKAGKLTMRVFCEDKNVDEIFQISKMSIN